MSASTGKTRPGWEDVLGMVEAGAVSVVIAYHLDRMTRTMIDLEELILLAERHGVGIATATGDIDLTNDAGRMVARILAAVARAEVERKGARQRLAAEQRAKAGKAWWPRRPFGLEMDGSLREDEAEALRKAYRDLLAGVSLLTLARDLNEAAYFTNRGKPWTATSLRPVLLNARNAGIRVYEGEEVGQADWEAIVPEETYRAAVRVLNDPGRDTGGGGRIPRNLVSGIAVCGRARVRRRRQGRLAR